MGHKTQGCRIMLPMIINMTNEYTLAEVKEYIQEAINQWSGQYEPSDELFNHDFNIVFGGAKVVGSARKTSKRRKS